MLATISYLRPAVIIATIIRGNYQIIARDNQYGIIFKDFLNKSFKAKNKIFGFIMGVDQGRDRPRNVKKPRGIPSMNLIGALAL